MAVPWPTLDANIKELAERTHLLLQEREIENIGAVSATAPIAAIWNDFFDDWRQRHENETIISIDYGSYGDGSEASTAVSRPIVEETVDRSDIDAIFGSAAIAVIFDYVYETDPLAGIPAQMAGRLKDGRYFYWRAWNYDTMLKLDNFDFQGGTKVYLTDSYADLVERLVPSTDVLDRFLRDA